MERTYAGLQRPDCEREPPDCEGCRNRDAMLDELQRDRDQYMAWYALADAERRQAQAEVERHDETAAALREAKSALRAVYAMVQDRDEDMVVLLEMIEEAACTGLEDWEREAAVREYREGA